MTYPAELTWPSQDESEMQCSFRWIGHLNQSSQPLKFNPTMSIIQINYSQIMLNGNSLRMSECEGFGYIMRGPVEW